MTAPRSEHEIRQALQERDIPQHRPGFFGDLESQLAADRSPANHGHSPKWRYVWIGPAAAAAGVAALVLVSSLNNETSPSQVAEPPTTSATSIPQETVIAPTLAAQVIERASAKIGSVRSFSAKVQFKTFDWASAQEPQWTNSASETNTVIRMNSEGDVWMRASSKPSGESTSLFSARTGEEKAYFVDPSGKQESFADIEQGIQDRDPLRGVPRLSTLTSLLRAMASNNDPSLKEVTFNGRPAWELEVRNNLDELGLTANHWVVTVDQETSFPVKVSGSREGKPFEETTVTDLQVNPQFAADDFTFQFPKGVEITKRDHGYRRVQLEDVRSIVGYEPFVPSYVPRGFELFSVAANKDAGPGGPEGLNENNRNVVVLTYRRGLEMLQITTRASANGGVQWNDPLSYEGEPAHPIAKVKLTSGALSDLTADVITKSTSDPHLWVIGSRWLLTISGDAGHDDLVRVANSIDSPSAKDRSVNPSTTIP